MLLNGHKYIIDIDGHLYRNGSFCSKLSNELKVKDLAAKVKEIHNLFMEEKLNKLQQLECEANKIREELGFEQQVVSDLNYNNKPYNDGDFAITKNWMLIKTFGFIATWKWIPDSFLAEISLEKDNVIVFKETIDANAWDDDEWEEEKTMRSYLLDKARMQLYKTCEPLDDETKKLNNMFVEAKDKNFFDFNI